MPTATKLIVILILISLVVTAFSFNIPPAHASLYFLKEFIIKPLVRKLANALENKLVNKINGLVSGLQQKIPSFILNWRNHIFDSQARGNDIFRSVLADARLCPYFQKDLRETFGADKYLGLFSGSTVKIGQTPVYQNKTFIPGLNSFQTLTGCTLPSNLNVDAFRKDFGNGGWDAWNQLIQPQNNFYGTYNQALKEQGKQIETEQQSARDEAIAGQGFLAQRLGTNGESGPAGCTGSTLAGGGGRCIWFGKEVTPPKFLGDLSAKSLDTKIGRVGAGQEITDVIFNLLQAVVNGLANRILNFIGQGSYNQPPPYQPEATPPPSNFDENNAQQSAPDFTAQCKQACQSDENTCLASVGETCTTDSLGQRTCQRDPDGVANCDAQRRTCKTNCDNQVQQ